MQHLRPWRLVIGVAQTHQRVPRKRSEPPARGSQRVRGARSPQERQPVWGCNAAWRLLYCLAAVSALSRVVKIGRGISKSRRSAASGG